MATSVILPKRSALPAVSRTELRFSLSDLRSLRELGSLALSPELRLLHQKAAMRRGLSELELLEKLLRVIAEDGLWRAILDDEED